MKIVYIAHPIGGAVGTNVGKVLKIIRDINMTVKGVIPIAPYIADVLSLSDNIPRERALGLRNCKAILNSGIASELWLYGSAVTPGMREEIEIALDKGMKVFVMDPELELPAEYHFIRD